MARLPRCVLPERGFFHVIAVAVHETAIVRDPEDALEFLGLLAEAVRRFRLEMHAFCLMTTHYHLVLEAGRDLLSAAMHWVNGVHALRYNRRYARRGHLFGDRFWSRLIDSDEQLRNTSRYVILNPVRAGLCTRPEDWPWLGTRYGFDAD